MNNEFENMKQDLEEDWTVNEPNFHSKRAADAAIDGEVSTTGGGDLQNQASSDEWAMNTMVSSGGISDLVKQLDAEKRAADTQNTNPLEEKSDSWQMPEPVFRVSSGKKVEKSASIMPPLNFSAKPPETSETTDSATNIQPQPYISEALIVGDEDIVEKPPVKVKSKAGRTVFIVAGILAMVLFAVGFVIGIYFLFFHTPK
ncbi:hypothetical protein BH20ACI1_BH20ACI1_16960 [soil metagenome]